MPLLPFSIRMAREQARGERESLLDSVLPAPTHPRARKRALATSAVAIFFLLAVWMACTDSNTGKDEGELLATSSPQRWVWEKSIDMDGNYDATAAGKLNQEQASQQDEDQDALREDEVDLDSEEDDGSIDEQSKAGLAKYVWHEDLEWDADGSGRLIVVGDVHGMVDELKRFLRLLEYSPDQTSRHNDTLVFVGDLVAKSPDIKSSLASLAYIRSINAHAVRGNHDQDVLNWRHWMESASLEGLGQETDIVEDTSAATQEEQDQELAPPEEVPQHLRHKWRDEHFKIAKQMSQKSADWLAKRSMTLHIRSLHTYVVHAGLLPWTIPKNKGKKKVHTQDDEADTTDFLQNLDFSNEFGITPDTSLMESSSDTEFLPVSTSFDTSAAGSASQSTKKDLDPEIAILTVPLNRKPFTLLEMRGIKKNGKVTKDSKKGVPWAPIWNQVMKGCQQTISATSETDEGDHVDEQESDDQLREEDEGERKKGKKHIKKMQKKMLHLRKRQDNLEAEKMKPGQCRPLNVVYGHAAARGLDLHAYSFGLDSGAVYGRSFSALVVEGAQWKDGHPKSKKLRSVDVAIAGRHAKVYSMSTKKP